jgi:lipoprotein-anchoring transpeptidase ErfK/SrfK
MVGRPERLLSWSILETPARPAKPWSKDEMIGYRIPTAVAAAVAAALTLAGPASAQNWDWGGGSEVGGSGRQSVRFSTQYKPGQIVASFSDRRLYLVTRPGEALSYPIAIPREQSRWQGAMTITQKRENPSWTPTPTMRAENPRLPSWVPGGHPMNPLGNRALYLGSSMYRIHGTDAPWTIGQPVSKGCIRMYNQDAQDLYDRVKVGTNVVVTWQQFSASAVADAGSYEPTERKSRAADRPRRQPYDGTVRRSPKPQRNAAAAQAPVETAATE